MSDQPATGGEFFDSVPGITYLPVAVLFSGPAFVFDSLIKSVRFPNRERPEIEDLEPGGRIFLGAMDDDHAGFYLAIECQSPTSYRLIVFRVELLCATLNDALELIRPLSEAVTREFGSPPSGGGVWSNRTGGGLVNRRMAMN